MGNLLTNKQIILNLTQLARSKTPHNNENSLVSTCSMAAKRIEEQAARIKKLDGEVKELNINIDKWRGRLTEVVSNLDKKESSDIHINTDNPR